MRRWLFGLLLAGCSLGARAQGAFEVERDLSGVQALSVDLPSTPIAVRGCDRVVPESCPEALLVQGRWHATGGTPSEARRNATRPSVDFETFEGLMRMSATVPLEVEGLVDLELDGVGLPSDVDLEVRTSLGDVEVRAMTGSVLVDVEVGDVDIQGEMRSTGVHVDEGQVLVEGPGAMDIRVERGGVRAEHTAGADETTILAPGGDVELVLGDDADVDLRIESPGRIRVQTDAFSAATTGLYRARSGTGATRVEIRAGGDVSVRLSAL
ncbi:MAG: hypothetical protein ACE37F_12815 [Nannocystaceae bacterium]|nr:DUF4097 domain-containing protein [bacterium]